MVGKIKPIPKWWFNGDSPWLKVKKHLKHIQFHKMNRLLFHRGRVVANPKLHDNIHIWCNLPRKLPIVFQHNVFFVKSRRNRNTFFQSVTFFHRKQAPTTQMRKVIIKHGPITTSCLNTQGVLQGTLQESSAGCFSLGALGLVAGGLILRIYTHFFHLNKIYIHK